MTTMTSGKLPESLNPFKGLVDYLAAFFKAPTAEDNPHHRTAQEDRELRRELRMLGGS